MKVLINFSLLFSCLTLFAQINVDDQQYCGPDEVTFTTTDAGCVNYDWYNENNVIIGTGCTVTTSSIAFDQAFTVTNDAVNTTISTGPVYNDPSFTSSTTFNGAGYDQNQFTASFEVKVPLTLESIDVYSVMNNNANCAQAFFVDLIAPDNSVIETLTPVTACGAGTEQITLVFNEVLQVGVHKIRIRDNGNKGTSEKFVSFLGGDFSTGGNYDYDYMRVLPDPFLGWYASFFNWQVTIPNVQVVNALDDCQANSCTNKGADFFKEDFGTGIGSASLPAGLTNYVYNGGTGLVDGQYAVSNNPVGLQGGWHNTGDFTVGDTDGRMLVVNASSEPGEFYKTTVSGLCENSYYSFSAQLMNILTETGYCPTTHIGLPINVIFQVEDLSGNIIGRTSTGDLASTPTPQWNEYSFGFYIPDNLTSVNVILINNYQGGCGNDLAIDDITFSPCGPDVTVSTDFTFPACYGDSVIVNGVVGPEIVNPDRQWQVSSDGGLNWTDIPGETGEDLVVVGALGNNNTTYRLAVTVAGNISTTDCRIFSNPLTYFSQSCCASPEVNISSSTSVCPDEIVQIDVNLVDVRLNFTISNGTTSVDYNDVSAGFSFDVSHGVNTTYTVTAASKYGDPACVVSTSDPVDITIFESVVVSSEVETCNNTATGYTVTIGLTSGDQSSYLEVDGQGSIAGSTFVSDEIVSGGSYEFKFSDANGCDTVTVAGDNTCACLTDAGSMSLTAQDVCESSNAIGVHTAGFLDGDDMYEFILHTSNSDALGTIIERSTTSTFDFDPNTMTAEVTYYLSVIAGNNNGGQVDLNDPCLDVSVGTPIVFYEEGDATLSGGTVICDGEVAILTINITPTTGVFDVVYSVDGSNQTLSNVSDGREINVSTTGDYSLGSIVRSNAPSCLGTVGSNVETVTVNDWPIVSNVVETCNNTATGYTVTFDISEGDASSYLETSGQGNITGTTFTSSEIATGGTYEFNITDNNSCDTAVVTGGHTCDCLTEAEVMGLTLQRVCESATAVGNPTGGNLDADDIFEYILHTSNNNTLGTIIERSNTPNFTFDSNTMTAEVTYYMSAVAGNDVAGQVDLNDPCLEVSVGTPIIFYEEGDATLSGGAIICEGEMTPLTVSITPTTGDFDVVYNVNGTERTLVNVSDGEIINVTTSGSYNLVSIVRSGTPLCPGTVGSNIETVVVNDWPEVSQIEETCNGTATDYTVTFTITNGDASSYEELANQGNINNGVFTSDLITSGDAYSFNIADANDCFTTAVSGSKSCNCLTDAGEMNLDVLSVCGSNSATAIYVGNGNLDADDVLEYILHTGSTNSLGTIIDRSDNPNFVFDGGAMTYQVTYYISAVVGSNNGSGQVDLTDPCLDVAQGTPVRFYEEPQATLSGGAIVCQGEEVDLLFTITPITGVFDVVYAINGVNDTLDRITNGKIISVDTSSDFNLVSIIRSDEPLCSGQVTSGVETVTVNNSPVVPIGSAVESCNNTATGYTVTFTISEGDLITYQELSSQGDINGSQFTSDLILSGDSYNFQILDGNGCDTAVVTGSNSCDCITEAGNMDLTMFSICDGTTATGVHSGETLDGDDVLEFILHTESGTTLGTIIDRNATGEFGFNSTTMTPEVTYYISAVAGSNNGSNQVDLTDPCVDVAQGTPISFYEVPNAFLSGAAIICQGENVDLTVSISPATGLYDITYSIDGSSETRTGISDGETINVTTTSNYNLVSIDRSNAPSCPGSVDDANVSVVVNDSPINSQPDETCNGTATGYVVTFNITGGDISSYQELNNQGSITNGVFTSDLIDEGAIYEFNILDGNGCDTTVVTGSNTCECVSDAGQMELAPQQVCESSEATGTNNGSVLDDNDVLEYVLHTSDTDTLGDVVSRNSNGIFTFDSNTMTAEVTYYLSAIVGDNNGSGQVSLTDPCMDVAIGAPVTFYEEAIASLTGGGVICDGETARLTLSIEPSGPRYSVVYSVNEVNQSSPFTGFADGQTFDVTTTSTYELVSILRVGTPTCPGDVGTNIETVQVNGLPALVDSTVTCNSTSTGYTVSIELAGGDQSTYQELTSQGTINGNLFTSQLIDNGANYSFSITDNGGCSTVSVSGMKVCQCLSDAGSMTRINQSICSSGIVSSTHLGGQVLDGNDVIEYVLHTDTVDVYGSIIERSKTPDFFFDIEMADPSITYYVSTLVGDSTLEGHVDTDDVCVSTALGSSIRSYRDSALLGTLIINHEIGEHSISGIYTMPEILLEDTAQVMRFEEGWESPESWQWFWFDEEADSLVSLGIRFPVTNTPGTTALPPASEETEYSITYYMVTYNGVCYDTSTAVLNLDFDIFIPDAFSPNNDNSFDTWEIKNLDKYPEASVLIYNRWGNVVAELNDISTVPWDGNLNGKELPMGTYYYLLTVEKGTEALTGDVSILR